MMDLKQESLQVLYFTVDGDRYAGYNRFGVSGGLFTNIRFSEFIGGQTELKYIQKGSKHSDAKSGTYFELKLDYIEVPVLVNVHFYDKMYLEAGLSLGYLVVSKEDRDGYGFYDPYPEFDNYELGFIAGFNYSFSEKWVGNIRYSYSVLPVRPHPGNQTYYFDRGNYNNLVNFALYYYF